MTAPSQPPEISLIVNTYMKPRHLSLVLDSIEHQEGIEGRFEVVISDDGSTDNTADLVAKRAAAAPYRLAFTTRPHDGFRLSRVRNDGVRVACGARLLFLDGDCMLPRDHVAIHLERCREGVATGGDCGRLDAQQSEGIDPATLNAENVATLLSRDERTNLRRKLRKWWWYTLIRHSTKPRLVGNNICIHRQDFERVNGFDERFVGWGQEDDDITLRLRAAGVRLETVLDRTCSLHVWHPTDPTATARWRDGANVPYFLRKGRLTRCREGFTKRSPHDLGWQLPEDLPHTATGRALATLLHNATSCGDREPRLRAGGETGRSPEIDVVIRPGTSQFRPRATKGRRRGPECRLLLIEGSAEASKSLQKSADVVRHVSQNVASPQTLVQELSAVLEQIG
jgi:glycosyltransferase involved in cell wall biosynthesis